MTLLRGMRSALLGILCLAVFSATTQAQALKQLAPEPLVVIKVNNLQAVNGMIGQLATKLGLNQFSPAIADPLSLLKQQIGIREGLDPKGELVIAIYEGEMGPPEIFALVPTADYQALIGNFPDVQKDGELDVIDMESMPMPAYVLKRGAYAAVSTNPDLLQVMPEALALEQLMAEQMDKRDLAVFVNFRALSPKILPQMQLGRNMIMQQQFPGVDPKQAETSRQMALAGFNAVEKFVRGTSGLVTAISLQNEGISSTCVVAFEPGSELANAVGGFKTTDQSFLAGLPAEAYSVAGGWVQGSGGFWGIFESLYVPAFNAMKLEPEVRRALDLQLQSMKQSMEATNGGGLLMLAPAEGGKKGLLSGFFVIHGDAKRLLDLYPSMIDNQDAINKAMGQPISSKVELTPAALTVDGVKLDKIVTTVSVEADAPNAKQMQQIVNMMYGGNTVTAYYGAVNPNTVIVLTGVDQEDMDKAIAAAKAGAMPLSDNQALKAVSAMLPASRTGELFVAVSPVANAVMAAAREAGANIAVQLPPDLPPMGLSFGAQGNEIRFDTAIPTDLIQGMVSAGIQAAMQQQMQQRPRTRRNRAEPVAPLVEPVDPAPQQ